MTSCSQSLGTRKHCTWGCTWIKEAVSTPGQRRQKLFSSSRCFTSWMAAQEALAGAFCNQLWGIGKGDKLEAAWTYHCGKCFERYGMWENQNYSFCVGQAGPSGKYKKQRHNVVSYIWHQHFWGGNHHFFPHVSVERATHLCLLGTPAAAI